MVLQFGRFLCVLWLVDLLYCVPMITGVRTALPQESVSPARLIREAIQLALQNDAEQATQRYYQALESPLNDSLANALFTDIKDLLIPSEIASYKSASDKSQWLRRFWLRHDPTPATLANERLVEHYLRLQVARTRYRSPQPRGYDDRGVIYVRYGPPDDRFISSMGEFTRDNESWVYHRLGDVSFDFIEYGGLFYLVDDISKAIVPNENKLFSLVQLFEERSNLNLAYQVTAANLRMVLQSIRSGQAAPAMRVGDIIRQDYIARIDRVKQSLPAHASTYRPREKPLKFVISLASFGPEFENLERIKSKEKGVLREKNTSRLELYYAILLKELIANKLFDGSRPPYVFWDFAVYNKVHDLLLQKEDSLKLDLAAVLSQKDYVSQLTFFLQPDTYRIALDIRSPQTNQRGMMQMLVAVPEFPKDRLSMSDIELASIVRPAAPEDREKGFIKNGLYVRPYPYRVIVRQQPIFVYFEIYGLFLDESGTARYRVTYEVEQKGPSGVLALLSALNPFGGKKSSLSLSYEYTTDDRYVPQYTSLDFSGLEPGEHRLVVRVEDLVAGVGVEKKIKFKLVQ
ncbi:MAG: GWxTD domain-containing protein [candidate division KSB1 bacterium]|nr:GWxTD domain-containing protein [candidate division KSB1 bacterium]